MTLWNKALIVIIMTWRSAIDKVSTLLLCLWISVSNTCWNNDERLMYTAEKTSCLFQSCCHHLSVALQLSLSMQHIDPGPLISCRDSISMDSNKLIAHLATLCVLWISPSLLFDRDRISVLIRLQAPHYAFDSPHLPWNQIGTQLLAKTRSHLICEWWKGQKD